MDENQIPKLSPIEPEKPSVNTEQSESPATPSSETPGTGEYVVGRGKPPRAHRWKPGQSGNPKGRKKGSKNESTILREQLDRKVKIRAGGKERFVTAHEGIVMRFVDEALKGDVKSAQFVLNRFGALVSGELGEAAISENDRDILEEFKQSLLDSNNKKED
jgi:hypothetical protein